MTPGWPTTGQVWDEVGNRITQRMTRLPSGESCDGDPEPNPLGLGFVESGVGEGGSAMWYGIISRSLIIRSAVPLVRGSTASDPLSCSSVV
jgi:hypothetical protein